MYALKETVKGIAMHPRGFAYSLVLIASLLVGLVACTSDEAGTPSPTPSPIRTESVTPTPTSSPTEEPPGEVRFEDAGLQAVHDAIVSRDIEALAGMVEYQVVGCTHALGAGGPPKCEDGRAEGEQVRVFPIVSCEGGWTATPLPALVALADSQRGLHAAVVAPGTDNLGWPEQDAYLIYYAERNGNPAATRVHVGGGRIIALWSSCGADTWEGVAEGLAKYGDQELEFLVEPRPPGEARGAVPAPTTGIEGVDEVLAMVARYDLAALAEYATAYMLSDEGSRTACVEEVHGPGEVACDPKNGEVTGDSVAYFPVVYCSGSWQRSPSFELARFLNGAPQLHSVVDARDVVGPPPAPSYGAYWLVYVLESPDPVMPGARLQLTEQGEVMALWFGCVVSAEELATYAGEALPVIVSGDR